MTTTDTTAGPRLLTEPEVAEQLNISLRSLRWARQRGQISAVRIGRSVRYQPQEIDRFIRDNTTPRADG